MKLKTCFFMRSSLSVGVLCLWAFCLMNQPCFAVDDSDVVEVSMTVPAYVDVDIVSQGIIMNPVTADEFYRNDGPYPILHSGSSLINLRSNVDCSLRTREDLQLTHSSGDPALDVSAAIRMLGANVAHLVFDGGVYYWVLNFPAGDHNGTTEVSASIQQEWTVSHLAGIYTGTITVELLEGTI